MKALSLQFSVLVAAMCLAACGDDTSSSTSAGGGSGGGATSSTSSVDASSSVSSSQASGSVSASSGGDGGTGGTGGSGSGGETGAGGAPVLLEPACDVPTELPAGACVSIGGPGLPCNPVNGDGCDVEAGESCDWDPENEGFACYPPPNGQDICEECPGAGKSFCRAGSTCDFDAGVCAKFCCDDADCGEGNSCIKDAGLVATYPYSHEDAPIGACYPTP